MNRQKFIFLSIVLLVIFLLTTTIFLTKKRMSRLSMMDVAAAPAHEASLNKPIFSLKNAFVDLLHNRVTLPDSSGNSDILNKTGTSPLVSVSTTASSLRDVARIVAKSKATEPTAANTLTFPDVSDGELAIDSSGASTTIEYLTYFNSHAKDIVFNMSKFKKALKNKNGLVLFVPDLIDKAITDNNFSEIKSSLDLQREFATAEIDFLKSIKVTGSAVVINKKAIGAERLVKDLIDEATLVASGSLAKADFINYYSKFKTAMSSERQNITAQSGISSLGKGYDEGVIGSVLDFFGLKTVAVAQSSPTPFGGKVLVILPCDCDVGDWVIIGPPVPASLFVSYAFLATPLFFPEYAYYEGAWWLGLYWPEPLVPCNSEAALCGPIGFGGEIIMTGTSL